MPKKAEPRDMDREAYDVLCDLTLTPRQALINVQPFIRRKNDINAAFIMGMGWRFRELKWEQRLEADQLARWADDGGAA